MIVTTDGIRNKSGKVVLVLYDSNDIDRHISITRAMVQKLESQGFKVYCGTDVNNIPERYKNGYIDVLRYDTKLAAYCLGFSGVLCDIDAVQYDIIHKIEANSNFLVGFGIKPKDMMIIRVSENSEGWKDCITDKGVKVHNLVNSHATHYDKVADEILMKVSKELEE